MNNLSYICALFNETKIINKMTQLKDFIENMPHGKADEFRNRVVSECKISQALFRLWRNGLDVPEKYHPTINSIATEMFGVAVFIEEGCA